MKIRFFIATFCLTLFIAVARASSNVSVVEPDFTLSGMANVMFVDHPDGVISFGGVGGYARYNFFTPSEFLSISIGTVPSFGIEFAASNQGSFTSFFIDAPAEIALNIGEYATRSSDYYLGCFIAAGINYNYSVFQNPFFTNINAHTFGPHVAAGFRWQYQGRTIGLRVSYTEGMVNNFKKDPSIIYERSTVPRIFNIGLLYGAF